MSLNLSSITRRFIVLVGFGLLLGSVHADPRSLEEEIKARHFEVPATDLPSIFGGEDQVVTDLIKLRDLSAPPYVSTRAEKLLLAFSSREDVRATIRKDVVDPGSLGLCSIILSNLSEISDEAFRMEVAQLAVDSINTSSNNKVLPSRINRIKSILTYSKETRIKDLVDK